MDSVEKAKEAINKVFTDNTVTQTTTWERLQLLVEECAELQQALDEAEQNQ